MHEVVEEIHAGRGVVVLCDGGTGRTGTVLACVLRQLGVPSKVVLDYMKGINKVRGKNRGWPEAPWQRQQFDDWPARPTPKTRKR